MNMLYVVIVLAVFWLLWYLINAIPYRNSSYYDATQRSFLSVFYDKGAYGEYLIYKRLRRFEDKGAMFLFNCYVPKSDDETSEVDVLMIYHSGIYVFESKNYGGWIFGSENGKTWTQTLPNGKKARKEHFYNPIMQNRSHIIWLEKQVEETNLFHNIVVFSERCEFKNLEITNGNISVIKRHALQRIVESIDGKVGNRLDDDHIRMIYEKLYPYTQVSKETK